MAGSAPGSADGLTLDAENSRLAAEIERLGQELARLRENEKMYRAAAEVDGRIVWMADSDGAVTLLGKPFAAITGMAEGDALGNGWLSVIHPDEREQVRLRWRESVATGKPFEAQFRTRVAGGSYRTMRSRAAPFSGSGQQRPAWYGTTQDIEEEVAAERARREAVERLRESEEMHRVTLELTQQIVWTVEPDGSGLQLSQRYQDLTGMGGGDDARLSIHPDDRDKVAQSWAATLESGMPYAVECRLRMRDGSYRLFRVRAMPQRDGQDRILRWYGISEDVDDRAQAELARRDVEERYRLAARATNDAIWDHDFTLGMIDWSDNAAAIVGSETPLGRTPHSWWSDRIHPDEKLSLVRSLAEAIEGTANRWSGTYRFRRDDGSYADLLDRGFIIRDSAGKAVRAVGAMADLTERHRAEAEIRRMQAELIHVSRLSAMGAMASTLAHELNQPLTALANFISGAKRIVEKDGDRPQPALLSALAAAESGALRAGEIIRRLRELVSRGTVSVVVEHLPRLVEDAAVLAFVDEHKLGVSHRLDLDPAAQWVSVDRVQIQQVLINLVRNAVEAMQDSAVRKVVISTRGIEGGMVEVRVDDTGPGIGPDEMDELFSQFMTTKRGGMGVGLPISRTIIEAHGGTIWVENRDGGGGSFRFTLPAATPRDKAQL